MKNWMLVLVGLMACLTMVLSACTPTPTPTATAPATTTAAPSPTPSPTATAADFYKTNGVSLIINGSVGGGTDMAGQTFARYWTEATGGPAMMVVNKSGAGGIEGLNYVQSAKPDGTTIGLTTFSSDIGFSYLTGNSGVKFDPGTLQWIGMFGSTPHLIVEGPDSPWKTLADLQAQPKIKWGQPDASGSTTTVAAIALTIFGLTKNSQTTIGFPAAQQGIALKSGEIQMAAVSGQNYKDDKPKGLVKGVVMMEFTRNSWDNTLPSVPEFLGRTLTTDEASLLNVAVNVGTGKAFFAPPGTDPAKLEFLRRSFDKLIKIPKFVTDISVRFNPWDGGTTGEIAQKMEKDVLATDKALVAKIKAITDPLIK
jgi:tripartite-type tricarboxylate transporter receptor subunit TctC